MRTRAVRVLVVDDSAFARKVIREVLSASPDIEVVAIARDGLDALEKIAEFAPDVVTLDLVMPNLDGVGVLHALQARSPRPAVVIVSMTDEDSELGTQALAAGAFDVVKKPTALAIDRLYELSDELRAKVLAAARPSPGNPVASAADLPLPHPPPIVGAGRTRLLVIGASTGGPQALAYLIRALPVDFPVPIAVVLHIPPGYTDAFARRLDSDCPLDVLEAREGLPIRTGQVVIGRAGMHFAFAPSVSGQGLIAKLDVGPLDTPHRPSVDVLFRSAAEHAGAGALGVVLTGMGSDGLAGSRAIRGAGGRILTEAEVSCVVYGMPRSVFEAGLATAQAPLQAMPSLILKSL
jgi:two-component system chemotaxis response regulator CheB